MTIQVWGCAVLVVAASITIGQAIRALGGRCAASAPAVGFAVLIVVAAIAIKLPGRAATAAVVLLVLLIAAAVLVLLRARPRGVPLAPAAALVVAAFGAAIPFVANGRVGLLGVSLDNDTANHLQWAQALRSPIVGRRYGLPTGYPLGPHSFIDALASGTGARLDLALTGLLVSVVLLTAVVAAGALRGEAGWKRCLAGVLGALLYLPAAYYAEGAFKETILSLFLLATVLQLEQVRRELAGGPVALGRGLLPLTLVFAAAIYVYSYLALVWLALTIVIWLAGELALRPWWPRLWWHRLRSSAASRREGRRALAAAGLPVVVGLVLLAPSAGRIASFVSTIGTSPAGTGAITTSNAGNLAGFLSPYESLGIWNSHDFRFFPTALFHGGLLSALAVAVLLFGLGLLLARRELIAPAAIAASALIAWRAMHGQSPYVAAKALVVPGALIAVVAVRGLLSAFRGPVSMWVRAPRLVVAVAFVGFAALSSYETLRDEPVWPAEPTSELLTLAGPTRGQSLLFLGASDYASWLFADSRMSALAQNTQSLGLAAARVNKPNTYGTALDFDSVDPATINRFTWVITSTTDYASEPPTGFRLVRSLPMFELWRRVATVAPRQVIEPAGAPGAVLDCRMPADRALSRRPGIAAVMTAPVLAALSPVLPGGEDTAPLRLAPGRWQLSLQYTSPDPLLVSVPGHRFTMPAYLDRPGPFFAVGTVTSTGGPITVAVRSERPSSITGPALVSNLSAVVAVREPATRTIVPLRSACGRYVDWYRVTA